MKRVIFTLIAASCCAIFPYAGGAQDAPDPYAQARGHALPPLPRMVSSSLTAGAVTALVDRERARDAREREVHSHVHVDANPPRDFTTTIIVHGDDVLRRNDDAGTIQLSGTNGGRRWVRTPNGTTSFQSFTTLAQRGAERDEALGETASPHRVVVRRLWRDGSVQIDHFDLDTGDEVRQDDFAGGWITSIIDRYRSVGGDRYPFAVSTDDNGRHVVERVDDITPRPVAAAEVAIPPDRSVFALAAGTMQTLPVRLNDGEVEARVDLGGKTVDFILDSGSPGSFIDTGVAQRLHLEKRGRDFIVPTLRIGSYGARNVALRPERLDGQIGNGTEVGILGGDFFSSFVVGIDYVTPSISLIDPASFDGSRSGGFALPIRIVGGVPFASLGIGDHASDRFVLDTGSNKVVVTARFARRYADDVRDRGGNFNHSLFHYFSSYGAGSVNTYPAVVGRLQLGSMAFTDAQLLVEQGDGPPARAFRAIDGIVGYNLLRFFDIWFDYGRGRAWLAPNGDRSLQRKGHALPDAPPIR